MRFEKPLRSFERRVSIKLSGQVLEQVPSLKGKKVHFSLFASSNLGKVRAQLHHWGLHQITLEATLCITEIICCLFLLSLGEITELI
jgi:hypothetical protein